MHERFAAALDDALDRIEAIQRAARENGGERARPLADADPPHAEGLDRARERSTESPSRGPGALTRFRSPTFATTPSTCGQLEEWMRSYRPEELFDEEGRLVPELAASRAGGRREDEREPARERRRAVARPRSARLPRVRRRRAGAGHGVERGDARARDGSSGTSSSGTPTTSASSARTRRRRTASATCSRSPTAPGKPRCCRPTRASRPEGRVMEILSEHLVPGLARGVPAHRPPRRLQLLRGVHPHRGLDVQPAREVAEGDARDPVASAHRLAQLPAQLTRLAPGPQRLLAPGSRLHRPRREQEGGDHPRLPAAGREHAALGRRPLPAQPALRQRRSSPGSSPR